MSQLENSIGEDLNPNYLQTVFQAASFPPHWPPCFAVVTANNPNGILHSKEANQKFDSEFQNNLKLKNVWYWRVSGASPDFSHVEHGFAIEVSLEEALEFGNRLKQEAIFWIEGDSLFIISCNFSQKINLGSWIQRLRKCLQP
jgi:hypothetical protein